MIEMMTKDERDEFRKAAKQGLYRLRKAGKISGLQRGRAFFILLRNRKVEEIADLCRSQAVTCGLVEDSDEAAANIGWSRLEVGMDIEKLLEFFLFIFPMFL